jgi:copper chaperone
MRVYVEVDKGIVTLEASEAARDDARAALARLGYAEAGSAEGMQALAAKAKSFVSSAVGRIGGE